MSLIDDECTGFPVGNFGIAAEVAPDGRIFPTVMHNPPVLGGGWRPWEREVSGLDAKASRSGTVSSSGARWIGFFPKHRPGSRILASKA